MFAERMWNMHINLLTHTQRPQLQGFFLQLVKSRRRCICRLAASTKCSRLVSSESLWRFVYVAPILQIILCITLLSKQRAGTAHSSENQLSSLLPAYSGSVQHTLSLSVPDSPGVGFSFPWWRSSARWKGWGPLSLLGNWWNLSLKL